MIKIKLNDDGEYVVLNGHGAQLPDPVEVVKQPIPVKARKMEVAFEVDTQHGVAYGNAGDYLLMDVKGWFYPCEADVFEATYKVVEPEVAKPRVTVDEGFQ